jgi:hypothetical protein
MITVLRRLDRVAPVLVALLVVQLALHAAPPAVPATPAPVLELLSARPFTLAQTYRHDWRRERPAVESGYLLVLKVDPDLVYPRQTEEPVLYVGPQTAERVNVGHRSGHVVAIVPTPLDDREDPAFVDLERAVIFFGAPAMPERVDAEAIQREDERAVAAGLKPLGRERLSAARRRGGARLELANKKELLAEAMQLVKTHSPAERDLADGVLEAR